MNEKVEAGKSVTKDSMRQDPVATTHRRPLYLTIVAWWLILATSFSFVMSLAQINEIKSIARQDEGMLSPGARIAFSFVGLLVTFLCGIGVLFRMNRARWVFAVWHPIAYFVVSASGGADGWLFLHFLRYVIVVVLLFLPDADRYFEPPAVEPLNRG